MEFDRYATASQRLRNYAELNKDDTNFASNGGEIVYIIDTSVLESYWRREPEGTAGRYGTDDLLTGPVALYSGWLALKYLIEHRLPGQKQTAFLSPSHWNESLDRARKLEVDTRQTLNVGLLSEHDKVDQAFKSLSKLEDDPARMLKEAERLHIGKLFTAVMQAVSRGERLRRVFQNGRRGAPSVRDLTACNYYDQLPGSKLRHQDFRRWHAEISRSHREHDRPELGNSTKVTRNTDNDAITLATVQAMYRGTTQSLGKEPKVRFVFVSADGALHDAFFSLEHRLTREGIPFFIRHPHIYAPLLNFANMAEGKLSKQQMSAFRTVFDKVEEALEPLFQDYDLQSAMTQGYYRKLDYNVQLWSRNVETICLANSGYVISDTEGDYIAVNDLARILSSADVREAAANYVSGEIGRIRDSHLQVMSFVALRSLQKAGKNIRERGESVIEYRAPVKLVGVDLAGVLGLAGNQSGGHLAWLDDLLRNLRSGEIDGSSDDVLERLRKFWNDEKLSSAAQLLACCIFFAANAWESARLCAEICDRRIVRRRHMNVWLREAHYCEALAIRMQLRSKSDVNRGVQLLTNNIADHAGSLASIRDRVERATLVLTASIVQTIEDQLHQGSSDIPFVDLVARDELRSRVDGSLADLEVALEMLALLKDAREASTQVMIKYQAQINRLGALVFIMVLDRPVTDEPFDPSFVSRALQALNKTISDYDLSPSVTARMYIAVARTLIGQEEDASSTVLQLLESPLVADFSMSKPDEREVEFFKSYFRGVSRANTKSA